MNSFGVRVAISEDWDRPGKMTTDTGLTSLGQGIKQNSDIIHAHVMPFYHSQVTSESLAWGYISDQVHWLRNTLNMPTMITETQVSEPIGLLGDLAKLRRTSNH